MVWVLNTLEIWVGEYMADLRRRHLSRLSGRGTDRSESRFDETEKPLSQNRMRVWKMPGFWMVLLLAAIAFIVSLLTSCGQAEKEVPLPFLPQSSATTEFNTSIPSKDIDDMIPVPTASIEIEPENTKDITTEDSNLSIEPEYGQTDLWPVPYGVVKDDQLLYGFTNAKGIVTEPLYSRVESFTAFGLAVVYDENNLASVINSQGDTIIDMMDGYVTFTDDGTIMVHYYSDGIDPNKTQVYRTDGYLNFGYTGYLEPFHEGLAPSYQEDLSGYINVEGHLVIPASEKSLGNFTDGLALVSDDYGSPSHYIDKNGKDRTADVSSGISVIQDQLTQLFGYKNSLGIIIAPAIYITAEPFKNDTAIVQYHQDPSAYSGLYGLIDTQGKWIIPPSRTGIRRLRNGLFAVGEVTEEANWIPYDYMSYSKQALFSNKGFQLSDPVYINISDASSETVCLSDGDSIWFVDSEGMIQKDLPVIPGFGNLEIKNGVIKGFVNGVEKVYDLRGTLVADMNKSVDINNDIVLTGKRAGAGPFWNNRYPEMSGMKDEKLQEQINQLIFQTMGAGEATETITDESGIKMIETMDSDWSAWKIGNILCIEQSGYWYTLGSAHGMPIVTDLHINMLTGEEVQLVDLFLPESKVLALSMMSALVTAEITNDIEEVGYFVSEVEVADSQPFRLSSKGITLYWAPYELASYAAGFREFFIPWYEMTSVIDTESPLWKALGI